ncbi:hypothetical protein [Absidia glauca]|uniref:SWIRM domain-containing protein n=1 Tax=Absidia glauca TaxID=4829 RepID=A0A163J0D2_ABSGL|nr:hypothetical protein [Absidia glauca]
MLLTAASPSATANSTHERDLMSPPMTPKHLNNNDTTIGQPHDHVLDDEIAPWLPLTNHDGASRRPTSRKASLPHSTRAIKLVNCDNLDTIGRRFSMPFKKRPLPSSSSSSPPHQHHHSQPSPLRRKSVPKRSPSLASTSNAACGFFTLNVFDRPRQASSPIHSHSRLEKQPTTTTPPSPSLSPSTTTLPFPCTTSLPSPPDSHLSTKPKPDTFFYDHVDLSVDDRAVYDPCWLPAWEPFDNKPAVRVTWKGSPLSIRALPYYEALHSNEHTIASTLRLTPEQYLRCKRAMILSAQVFYQHNLPFRKSDAQKVCRIDVNKTSCLWGAFNRLGWFHPR